MEKREYRIMYNIEDTHWWFLAKRLFIQAILPHPRGRWKILDIGAGTGGTTHFLSRWGDVQAVEQSSIAVPYLKQRGIQPINRSIMECSFAPESFDLICAFDVLYHRNIKNDREVLERAYSWLKSDGYLCITDCAIPYLKSPHDKVMHARQRYWLSELADKIRSQQFQILKSSYTYFFTFPLFLIQRFLNALIAFNTVGRIPNQFNRFLLFCCLIESKLLPYLQYPIGSSVIILAQKHKTE
jgi:SAM-dependent methyltransferase